MAKSRRVTKSRTSARKTARTAKKRAPSGRRHQARPKTSRPSVSRTAAARSAKPAPKAAAKAVKPAAAPPPPPAPVAPPPRKPTYHEAVAMYERGLQALQRRDFAASAEALRNVIERYPEERELLERARLYLKVCERELEPKEPAPKSADEWVVAATVAQNSGDEPAALRHLQRALTEDPRHDHAHYLMAVATAQRNDVSTALEHLRRAIALNPENRSRARQDPDFDALKEGAGFRAALETPSAEGAVARPVPTPVRSRKARR